MGNETLQHHGILGMKWGVRRTPEQLARAKGKKVENESDEGAGSQTTKRRLKDMSDSELRDRISRLELEKRYRELSKAENQATSSKGKEFVMDVLEKSGKNIATQFTTYAMGTALNKMIGSEIVNPKKGQKDK